MNREHVLRFLRQPVTIEAARAVGQMMEMPNAVLIEALIQKNRMPFVQEDQHFLESAKQQARERIVRGKHHTFCHILGESGSLYSGIQETYRRDAEVETCAEVGAISALDLARDKSRTVVTVHFMPIPEREGSGVTTIVPPCLRRAGRFRHLYIRHGRHDFGIIVYHGHEPIKIAAKIVHLFPYPHGYNGDGTSQF